MLWNRFFNDLIYFTYSRVFFLLYNLRNAFRELFHEKKLFLYVLYSYIRYYIFFYTSGIFFTSNIASKRIIKKIKQAPCRLNKLTPLCILYIFIRCMKSRFKKIKYKNINYLVRVTVVP